MPMIVINTILPPNSMGILGKIPMGGKSIPSKARSSLAEGTRMGESIRPQDEKDIMYKEVSSSMTHQWMGRF